MSTLADLLAAHTALTDEGAGHLQRLVAEWQLLADLSFADLLMSVRTVGSDAENTRVLTVAQCRPNTASTVLPRDEVGTLLDGGRSEALDAVFAGRPARDSVTAGGVTVGLQLWPIGFDGEVIAVLTRAVDAGAPSPPSPLEAAYSDCANDLCQMVSDGSFPLVEGNPTGLSTPRAGDGFIRLDPDGAVAYASPNALSAFHRMGYSAELSGTLLADVITGLLTDAFEAQDAAHMLRIAVGQREPDVDVAMRMEVDARRATVLLRAVPLRPASKTTGAVVLIRDVTEVKRRDLALISKDATIREIHHRVKNNLQSVSALLRLQARRTSYPEARTALTEADRRVASIALVHELLSGSVDEEVDLDEVVDRLMPTLLDAAGGTHTRVRRRGRLGVLPAELAMPLVMVLSELIQNSVEHGMSGDDGGAITITGSRDMRRLKVSISDDGQGLPQGFDMLASERLGLQIVRTLVEIDLGGALELGAGTGGGTRATVTVPVR
ncbi:PAS domain-containing protein [Gordonia sp. TBRC 11910]|uniref:histidine kinase n=1 Tax=Gordonia asplenii TaxID=2725283 RepID=A0A848KYJ6_9ACTN|nr:PAS domain-containing sensor histidine kinase [Gordonia asplenii]NMO01925.1 PAS domain-containing protein [Gordonia asplenii]